MSTAARSAVIEEQLRELKLPGAARAYEAAARRARDDGWAYEDYLREVLEAELLSRYQSTSQRRIKEAHFPDLKTLEQIDWDRLQGISRPKLSELAACDYLDRRHDIVIAGPIGTGKTHLAIALGIEATKRRRKVLFRRAAEMVRELVEARDQRELGRYQRKLRGVDLLIIDELGFVPFDRIGGELLFNVFAERYERRSTLVTTNLSFSEWVRVFGDEKLTTALLDRLGHHAHILTTKGSSFRTVSRRSKTAPAA
jgi:DNA replication protein DnaC